ncbi:beta-glucosidase [Tripterygium wilfordii]|uniref:Beta-glucosidase n=1 Tax=Tripterygium wilfordii TaxID=458696 RepID=A0A7J7CRA5_TRIWF|nr:vicianin hydrolase-like [Tripterygium wilfordii]KAF5736406.1 beta-glucosidase [Tripterygium wilfordii]
MATHYWSYLLYCLVLLSGSLVTSNGAKPSHYSMPFNRSSFPAGFVFGAGIAAHQSEGAANIDGRGQSIWDTFTKNHPEKIWDHSTANIADDFYHHYKEDIQLMKKIGLDSFRFSISWSRVLPKGKISGGVNPLGVKFYNNLIDELLSNGLVPFVTIFHWDLPQALEDEYGGFLSSKIVNDFQDYADFCFKTFGDRVKHWVTLNEPYSYSNNGYNTGTFAPGRCSNYIGNCTSGNSATEPYIVAHNLLLSHGIAVKLYKQKYQAYQKGQIGITIVTNWFVPQNEKSAADHRAAYRVLDFLFGWFADPVIHGDYPKVMREIVAERLPKFTKSESEMLKGSLDFLGVNYYTTNYAAHTLTYPRVNLSYSTDNHAALSTYRNGKPIGTPTPLNWLFIYPKGIRALMLYIKNKYNNPPVYVTENGYADSVNTSKPIKEIVKDGMRIKYYHRHLYSLLQSIKEGANVKGYYAWSLFDDFEWDAGYTVGFGMIYVDFKNKLTRYMKYSAYWFKMFLLH